MRLAPCLPQVSSHYRSVPYHNFFHAVDVCHTVYWFIKRLGHKVGLGMNSVGMNYRVLQGTTG